MGAALARFFFAFFTPFFHALVDVFKRGALRRVAAWTTLIGLLVAMYAGVTSLLSGISMVVPDVLAIPASWIIPSNFNECLAVWLSGSTLISIYRWKRRGIQLTLGV